MPSGSQPASGPFARAIAEAIRVAMTRRRVSGAQLAERTSRSQTYISKRLRNEVPFTANDIEEICQALDEDLLKLLYAAAREVAHAKKAGPPRN